MNNTLRFHPWLSFTILYITLLYPFFAYTQTAEALKEQTLDPTEALDAQYFETPNMSTQFQSLENIPSFLISPHIDSIETQYLAIAENAFLTCLQKTGKVAWVKLIQEDGIDVSSFSKPPLHFTLNQLHDCNGDALPVYRLSLEFEMIAQFTKHKLFNFGTFWQRACYITKSEMKNELSKNIKLLFDSFALDYKRANPTQPKPEFYLPEEDSSFLRNIKHSESRAD
jgi:hypothetical protein